METYTATSFIGSILLRTHWKGGTGATLNYVGAPAMRAKMNFPSESAAEGVRGENSTAPQARHHSSPIKLV